RPDEIIDPYHYVEFDAEQLRELCAPWFASVVIQGVYGSRRYMEFNADEHRRLDALLAKDPLRLRRLLPRRARQRLYDWRLTRERRHPDPRAGAIVPADFRLADGPLAAALDLVAICADPRRSR
ncbi:MAG TPA: hypothetical protein VI111_03520, partial [Thermoleophilaceae bacterium]